MKKNDQIKSLISELVDETYEDEPNLAISEILKTLDIQTRGMSLNITKEGLKALSNLQSRNPNELVTVKFLENHEQQQAESIRQQIVKSFQNK
jgi:hypothetical protein